MQTSKKQHHLFPRILKKNRIITSKLIKHYVFLRFRKNSIDIIYDANEFFH